MGTECQFHATSKKTRMYGNIMSNQTNGDRSFYYVSQNYLHSFLFYLCDRGGKAGKRSDGSPNVSGYYL